MNPKLKEVLLKFKPELDTLWTEDGLPRLDVLSKAMDTEITREYLDKEAPGFSRATAAAFGQEAVEAASDGQAPAAPAAPNIPPAPTSDDHGDTVVDVPEVESRQSKLARLNDAVGEAMQAVADAESRLEKAKAELAEASVVKESDKSGMMARYQAAQHRIRAERVALATTVADSGVNLGALQAAIGPAPVDAARMNKRAVVPLVGQNKQ